LAPSIPCWPAWNYFEVRDATSLAAALIEGCIRNRPALYKAFHSAYKLSQVFYDTLSMAATAKLLGVTGVEGSDSSVLPQIKHDPYAQLDLAFSLLQKIAASDGTGMILILDEFQEINGIGDTLFAEYLRRIAVTCTST
jgi:hypothetical protein